MVTLLQTNGTPSRSFAPLTRWWPWTSGEWTGPLFSAAKKGFVIRESEVAMGKWPISGWFAQQTKPPEILHGQVWLPEGSTGRILSSKIGLLPKSLISAANIEHLTNKKLGYLNRNYGRYHHILHIYIYQYINISYITHTHSISDIPKTLNCWWRCTHSREFNWQRVTFLNFHHVSQRNVSVVWDASSIARPFCVTCDVTARFSPWQNIPNIAVSSSQVLVGLLQLVVDDSHRENWQFF